MLSDERYKKLMEDVGLPNSKSLLQALKQCAMEAVLNERAVLAKAMPAHKQEPVGYLVIGQGISFYKTTFDEARHQANLLEWRDDNEPAIHPVYLNPMPQQAAAIPESIAKQIWAHGFDRGHNEGIGCGHSLAPKCRHDSDKEAEDFIDEIRGILSAAQKPEGK